METLTIQEQILNILKQAETEFLYYGHSGIDPDNYSEVAERIAELFKTQQ